MQDERRKLPRQKSFLRGCIYFNNRRTAVDCLIRDITTDGARLVFSAAVSVPDVIELHIPQKEQTLRAHVEWRIGQEVGVAFAHAADTAAGSGSADIAERVTRMEAEIAALKRIVKRLQQGPNDSDAA